MIETSASPSVVQPIRLALTELEKQMAEIESIVIAMESRLAFVMRESEKTSEKGKSGVNTNSPLLSAIQFHCENGRSIVLRLSAIMCRLEI